jgi:NAD-dependent SIR2 family protein deacetylase
MSAVEAAADGGVDRLAAALAGRRFVALTGAGCSTESGIPDYRGGGFRGRPRGSIEGPEFRRSAEVRQRYWARASLGWDRIRRAAPNAGHRALAALEGAHLAGIITQNVDRLHQRAGSRRVVELHGALAEVRCLGCRALHPRDEIQRRLAEANDAWLRDRAVMPAPDGDAEVSGDALAQFRVVDCAACGGVLQPNVVFFGDSVARPVVDAAFALLEGAEALLVAGTSLAVYSGYRFLRRAVELGMPVAIVNLGPVRGEERAAVKVAGATGTVLPLLAALLG